MCPSAHALPILKPKVSALSLLLNNLSVRSLTSDPPPYFQRISTVGFHNPWFFWMQSTVMRFPLYSNLTIVTSTLFGLPVLRLRDLSSDDLSDMSDASPIGVAVSMINIQNESLPKITIQNQPIGFSFRRKNLNKARGFSVMLSTFSVKRRA